MSVIQVTKRKLQDCWWNLLQTMELLDEKTEFCRITPEVSTGSVPACS